MPQNLFRTIMLWVVWSSVSLLVVMTLADRAGFMAFIRSDPSHITWIILGLFAVGGAASFGLVVRLTRERVGLWRIEKQVRKGGVYAVSVLPKRCSISHYFVTLKHLAGQGEAVPYQELLRLSLVGFSRISHAVATVGSIMITLGLIGTVFGLTLTLSGLTGALDALGHDQDMLLSGLRQAMSGMGTAFFTTLLGAALGGVMLRVFAYITDHGIEELDDEVMRVCLLYCQADFQPGMQRELRAVKTEMNALNQELSGMDSLFSRSADAMTRFRQELDALEAHWQEAPDDTKQVLSAQQHYLELMKREIAYLQRFHGPQRNRVQRAIQALFSR